MFKHLKTGVPYKFTATTNKGTKTGLFVFDKHGELKICGRCSYIETIGKESSSTWAQLIEGYFEENEGDLVIKCFSYTFSRVSIEELLTDENLHVRAWAKEQAAK